MSPCQGTVSRGRFETTEKVEKSGAVWYNVIAVCRRDGSADTYGTRWDGSSVFGETYFVRIKPLHQSVVQHLRGYIPRRCFVASKSDKIHLRRKMLAK